MKDVERDCWTHATAPLELCTLLRLMKADARTPLRAALSGVQPSFIEFNNAWAGLELSKRSESLLSRCTNVRDVPRDSVLPQRPRPAPSARAAPY